MINPPCVVREATYRFLQQDNEFVLQACQYMRVSTDGLRIIVFTKVVGNVPSSFK
jgi:hypothetical protein